ncbi:hypothetical protein V6574_17985 [Streptomyces sp. SM1P]
MRRQTYGSTGRRGTAIAASAAALCLGTGLLSGCGSGPGDGYTAVGAAAGGSKPPSDGAPSGDVTLTPSTEVAGAVAVVRHRVPVRRRAPVPRGAAGPATPRTGPVGRVRECRTGVRRPVRPTGRGSPRAARRPLHALEAGRQRRSRVPTGRQHRQPVASGIRQPRHPQQPEAPAPPATPAALTLSAPQRAAADKRWCEKVTVEFRNTGGSPARSGTVTFATHIIGALGVDWATITSSQPLPAPIDARSTRSKTYTVCVESWRVPLGMRVETQDVSAVWE